MSREHQDCYDEINELKERNEYLISKFKELLENYAKVCSGEGYGNYEKIKQIWLKEIED